MAQTMVETLPAQAPQKITVHSAFPSTLPSSAITLPLLDRQQAGHLRHFHNLASQLDGEWAHGRAGTGPGVRRCLPLSIGYYGVRRWGHPLPSPPSSEILVPRADAQAHPQNVEERGLGLLVSYKPEWEVSRPGYKGAAQTVGGSGCEGKYHGQLPYFNDIIPVALMFSA